MLNKKQQIAWLSAYIDMWELTPERMYPDMSTLLAEFCYMHGLSMTMSADDLRAFLRQPIELDKLLVIAHDWKESTRSTWKAKEYGPAYELESKGYAIVDDFNRELPLLVGMVCINPGTSDVRAGDLQAFDPNDVMLLVN